VGNDCELMVMSACVDVQRMRGEDGCYLLCLGVYVWTLALHGYVCDEAVMNDEKSEVCMTVLYCA
jgi:hypothetical protein